MQLRIDYQACPLCDSKKIVKSSVGDCSKHPLYKPEIPKLMQWMDCQDCTHQFVSGYFSEAANELIFSGTHENQKVGFQVEQQRTISARMIEKIIPLKSSGVWLDVGFGNGSLLFTAQEYGFHAIGVDLRQENVKKLKELGIEAYCDFVESIDFTRSISVVSMMDVLEHIPYPKKVLKSILLKMEKSACLLISMPNMESIVWKWMTHNRSNPYLREIEHFHNFSRSRLFSLLEECGFQPLRYGISERYRACMEFIAIKK